MSPTITLQDLEQMETFKAACQAINRLEFCQKTIQAWSIARDEHDELTRDAAIIDRLGDIKREEARNLQVAQADLQQAFTAFLKALVKLLED